jgi:hypothetical protein
MSITAATGSLFGSTKLLALAFDESGSKQRAWDHLWSEDLSQLLQQIGVSTVGRRHCLKASFQVCNNRHLLETVPRRARKIPQERRRTSGPRSRTRTREGKFRTNWRNAGSVSRLAEVCLCSTPNLSQEIKSKSKERILKERWRINGGLEAHTYPQNRKKLRQMRTSQVCLGEAYP